MEISIPNEHLALCDSVKRFVAEELEPISLKVEAETVVFEVTDTGYCIPEELQKRLFQPFYRVAEARDRESGGAGIGLAIVEQAVRLHRGSVWAENAVGGGLQVIIELPIGAPA